MVRAASSASEPTPPGSEPSPAPPSPMRTMCPSISSRSLLVRDLMWPCPEDGRAHPHTGRALFDRDFKIVRHSHRKLLERQSSAGAQPVAQLAKPPEENARALGLRGKRGHRHEAANGEVWQPRLRLQQRPQLVRAGI